MKALILFLMTLFTVLSCSSDKHDPGKVRPIHGGELAKGPGYYLEVVGEKDRVKIYPLKIDPNQRTLEPAPTEPFEIEALYTFLGPTHVTAETQTKMPTGKSNQEIPLVQMEDHWEGQVLTKSMDEYKVILKVNYEDKKDTYDMVFDI